MEEEIEAEKNSYFPDFSDIYDESFQFWDFMGHKESSKNRPFEDEIIGDDDDVRPNVATIHSSLLKRDDSIQESHTFWDFLNSGVETNKQSPILSQFTDIFSLSDKVDEKLQQPNYLEGTNHDRKVQQKYSSSDEFWDFLNSSVENDENLATSASLISCSSSAAEKQLSDVPFIETTIPDLSKHSILPRISSVFSIKSDSSVDATPENNSQFKTATEVTHHTATFSRPKGDSKLNHYADVLNLQDSVTNSFPPLSDSPAKLHNTRSSSTPVCVDTQHLQLKVVNTESVCINNNGTGSLHVVLPNTQGPQNSNYSQYLIITNNTLPQRFLSKNEAPKNREQKITPQNSSVENRPTAIDDSSYQSDLRLAGYRNNHVLNMRKRNKEFPFDAYNGSESSLPVSNMPLDADTIDLISARIKDKQNKSFETVKKQTRRTSARRKPIKCIALGRCKNAFQQTETPISMEAFEAISKDTLPKPCNTTQLSSRSKVNSESIDKAGTNPLFLLNNIPCQNYSYLPITFTQIPIWNGKHILNEPVKQNITQSSSQASSGTQNKLPILSRRASPNVTKSLIFLESKPNKILLPKPPSFVASGDGKKIVVKTKKCRRKTVKELLQERQQNSKIGSEVATHQKESGISKYFPSDTASLPEGDAKRPIKSPTECCDDPKTDETASRLEGEKWPLEKSMRPRHYDMSELQIGFLKVQEDVDACGRFRSKFKVLFTKRQFLYDFPVGRCNQPSLKTLEQEWEEEMARIAVPFKTITSISLKDRMIYLKIDSKPQLSLMNAQSRFTEEDNPLWGHFLQSSFTHKVVLRKRQANKLKWILCQFDERFVTLTDIILTSSESQLDSPVSFKKRFCKNRKLVARRLPEMEQKNKSLLFNQMCSCRTNCRSIRCSCVKAVKSCSTTCQCTNCNNPLNVLETIGLDIHFSLKDSCLFQNIYQIPDLLNYLGREVRLECCNSLARIQECIPGTVLCPNINCNASLQYSWCQRMVSYPERNPRNHCSLCGQCGFSNGRHCHACKKCYAVTFKSNKCPTCLKENTMHKQLCPPTRSLNTLCYDKKMMCTSSKPQIIVLNSSSKNTPTRLPEENKNHFFSETIIKQNCNE